MFSLGSKKEVEDMLIYKGGNSVKKGTYWDLRDGNRIDGKEVHVLPGTSKKRYLRMPTVFMVLLAPFLGLLYFLFLPAASVVLVILLSCKKAWVTLTGYVSRLAYFEWRPTESYLGGKKKGKDRADKKRDDNG